ncbi:nuclear transport factor 2 family protein [Streptomyces coelicoflavus]|uniref:nuclear transport factor 2 family protein n=1 Tax=Streptomyces TaxID=1883 RepID=UPI00129254A8|nr:MULTISPECIES: nuclear transport factor 2 family protein [Streptomyces]MBQ0951254.1 nuclear transport factor 2 family protein [Streptomyces sp. RK76]MDI6520067.1 nuclear transport factor 2 family protein [Streptomyces coelicoflavus]QFX86638.1 nuclear transport factor 2 family protein [Streptomyces sp. SYP-A7193]
MATSRIRRSAAAVLTLTAVATTVLVGQAVADEDRPAAATAPASAAPAHAPADTADASARSGRVPRIAAAWHSAWTGEDPNALAGLFTKDGTLVDLSVPYTSHGREEIAEFKAITERLIPDADLEITDAFRSGDRVLIRTDYSGTLPGASRPFKVQMATVLELRHGKIAVNTDYYDRATMLRQSGLPADWRPPTQP